MNLISMSNMMYSIYILLVIFRVSQCQPVAGPSTELTRAQIQVAINVHNLIRTNTGDAADMRKLVWNDQMANNAQNYANLCNTDPASLVASGASGGRLINVRRETLGGTSVSFPAVVSSPSQCDPSGTFYYSEEFSILSNFPTVRNTDITAMVREWASEKEDYNIVTGTCSVAGGCSNYTQLVWASTSEVGCGIKRCSINNTSPTSFEVMWLFVCDYNPAGNIANQKPYQRGAACSECRGHGLGPWGCQQRLCVPR